MFARKPNPEVEELNKAITKVHEQMAEDTPESEEYAQMVDQLVKLYAQKEKIPSRRISSDTLVTVSGNLLGILIIVGYESRNVVTSKALGFIGKANR